MTSIPLRIQQQIDACCQRFEGQWKDGASPQLEEFLAEADEDWRSNLLRELLAIELCYRTDESGQPLTASQVEELHPDLMPEILLQMQLLSDCQATIEVGGQAVPKRPISPGVLGSTVDHQAKHRSSRGLHIRCPHCSNPVELLSDTPHESITCRICGSAFSLIDQEDRTADAPVLQKLGRFELVARLGVGGFGTVWKARDTELDRAVAIKIPRKGQLEQNEIEQFVREARMTAQLQHANIVPVHEVGREGETIFIVSDLVRGVSLSDWLSGDPPSFQVIAELVVAIAQGLQHAHQKGVIHRDLKPSNILIDESGQPHVMDFGLAKRETAEITMTIDGQILGTPAYMSPEQAGGESAWTDRRTDIYSLGVVLFRMLTGELPFRGNSQMQIHQRLTKDPPDPRSLNRFIPLDLSTICLKCLESNPNRRYSTAQELAEELQRFLRHEPILSRPISNIERTLRWTKRKPLMATTAALILFLAVAGPLVALLIERQRDRLQEMLVENNNLIDRYKSESQLASGKITDLSRQLDLWEGRANPWKFWPPKPGQSPRRNLIADMLDHSNAAVESKLREGKYGRETAARGYMGLGLLNSIEGRTAEARKYYERARDELNQLRQENPDQPQVARALAECYTQLAGLSADNDQDQATNEIQAARAIYQELATRQSTDTTSQIDWLESELISATMAGFVAGQDNLARVGEINSTLSTKWPTDPDEIYSLACYLAGREPILQAYVAVEPTNQVDRSGIETSD